jgi:type IV secretory pathway VirB4 component
MANWNIFKTIKELNEMADEPQVELNDDQEPEEVSLLEAGAIDLPRLVAPEYFYWDLDYCQIGDHYTRTLYVHTFPNEVEDNWLQPLLHFPEPLDVALFIQPLPVEKFKKQIEHQISQDEASLAKSIEDGKRPDARKRLRLKTAKEFLDLVQSLATKPYHVMLVMTVRAQSKEELDRVTKALEQRISAAKTRKAYARHKQGFTTTLPLMTNELKDADNVRLVHTQGLMTMFPFSSAHITHETGVLMGISRATGEPIIVNRFAQPPAGDVESPNSAILGASGSGKSYLAKMEMMRWAYLGVPVIVIDPSGEYRPICDGLGGENMTIALDSPEKINPLDFSHAVEPGRNALRNKIAAMDELLKVMLRSTPDEAPIDAVTKTIFANAMIEVYRRYGYHVEDERSQMNATPERMPVLREVVAMLARIGRVNRDPMVQERVRPLVAALTRFVNDGPLAGLFDHRTTVNLKSHFVNFNIANLADEWMPMAMHLVLEFLRTAVFTERQQESGVNRLIYVDEAQRLMAFPETAAFLNWTSRTCRKYGVGLTVMTQDVGVFVLNDDGSENKVGRGVLNNCSTTVLLKQHPNELATVQKTFSLTPGEVSRLASARYGEGILFVGQESVWFSARGMTHPLEHRLMSTSMQERAQLAGGPSGQVAAELPQNTGAAAQAQPFAEAPPAPLPPASQQTGDGEDPFGDPFADSDSFGEL